MDGLLERLRQCVASLPEVRLAVLFGSTARGQAGPRSDVDIGVLLEPDTPDSRSRIEVEIGRAVDGRDIDVIFLKDAPPRLRFEITKEGTVLFQYEDGLWTDFKAQAMIDWWDWEPYARMFAEAAARRSREKTGVPETENLWSRQGLPLVARDFNPWRGCGAGHKRSITGNHGSAPPPAP